MNILAFDTSTEKFSISILKNNKIVLNLSKIINKTYSKYLIPILKKSLEKSKLDVNADFYIMNAINVSKKEMGFFWTVGTNHAS